MGAADQVNVPEYATRRTVVKAFGVAGCTLLGLTACGTTGTAANVAQSSSSASTASVASRQQSASATSTSSPTAAPTDTPVPSAQATPTVPPSTTPTVAPTATVIPRLTSTAAIAPTSPPPSITFDMMANGVTLQGKSADLMASIGGADLMATTKGIVLDGRSIGQAPVAGHGFWSAFIDGKVAGLSICDTLSVPNDDFPEITAGPHTVQLRLLSNDRKMLAETPTITVHFANAMHYAAAAGPAGITITEVTKPSVNGRFEIRVQVSGFKMPSVAVGTEPVAGEGHWNAWIDGNYAGMSTTQMVAIPNDAPGAHQLTPGKHAIKVALVDNRDTAVRTAIAATASVVIGATNPTTTSTTKM